MDDNTYTYDEENQEIDRIDFTIWGNSEVLEMTALDKNTVGIDIPDLYDNMEPKRGGLIDPRLGITDNYIDCATCGLNSTYCPGHFGHITLSEAVFHMGYINMVKKILSCICLRCSKLLVYKNENELMEMLKNKHGKHRFAEIRNLTKNVTYCQKPGYGCGTPVYKIKKEDRKAAASINIVAEMSLKNIPAAAFEGKKKIRQILTPEICWNILKNISDTDCMIMGIDPKKSRPEMMIYKIFPVPPVQVRPSVKATFMASSTMEDDLTHVLASIIKANVRVRKDKESSGELSLYRSTQDKNLLQYHIFTYYDNNTLSVPKSEQRGKVIRALSTRIKGKAGRIRGTLMGNERH